MPSAGNPSKLTTYFGSPDGTFTAGPSTTTTADLGFLALADFNGDGFLDFALATNELAFGRGDGSFGTPRPFYTLQNPVGIDSIAVGDLNGDGRPDIVIADGVYDSLYILLNSGSGTFAQTYLYTVAACGGANYPAIGDLNGDGFPDIALGCSNGDAVIYLNDGHGNLSYFKTFTIPVLGQGVPLIADVNGDGVADLIVSEQFEAAVFIGTGSGAFATPTFLGLGPAAGFPLLMNLHGQSAAAGIPDIVIPDLSGRILSIINQTNSPL